MSLLFINNNGLDMANSAEKVVKLGLGATIGWTLVNRKHPVICTRGKETHVTPPTKSVRLRTVGRRMVS